jgi:Protein of unknown function (DUF3572)
MCLKNAKKTMLKFPKKPVNTVNTAKTIAISALSLLASNEDRLMDFIHVSGVDPSEIRSRTDDQHFLAAILDFFLADEKLLLEFCAEERLKPEVVHKAAHDLGGGVWEREWA